MFTHQCFQSALHHNLFFAEHLAILLFDSGLLEKVVHILEYNLWTEFIKNIFLVKLPHTSSFHTPRVKRFYDKQAKFDSSTWHPIYSGA